MPLNFTAYVDPGSFSPPPMLPADPSLPAGVPADVWFAPLPRRKIEDPRWTAFALAKCNLGEKAIPIIKALRATYAIGLLEAKKAYDKAKSLHNPELPPDFTLREEAVKVPEQAAADACANCGS